jgi:hypothetical protein
MIRVPSTVEVMLSGNTRVPGSVISVGAWAACSPAAVARTAQPSVPQTTRKAFHYSSIFLPANRSRSETRPGLSFLEHRR